MSGRLHVLCLDIEGGMGGSSRSLYESLAYMDRDAVEPEVWCRLNGPVVERYRDLGIACRVVPGLPKMNSLERLSRNFHGYAVWLKDFFAWSERRELAEAIAHRFDLVHFNHEALFLLAAWLRRRHRKPQTMHVRTMLLSNAIGRGQAKIMAGTQDRLVFITENEREQFQSLAGRSSEGTVIYNIASPAQADVCPHPSIPQDTRLKLAVLSNYAHMRGIDRVVEIAEVLAARGRRDVLFVVAGNMKLPRSLPDQLGEVGRAGGTLGDYAKARGVDDMILFLGHVAKPETVLVACDALIKPTRYNNPWGRDILEGMSHGKPILTVGEYNRFVENGVTGFLHGTYDAKVVADDILRLDQDRDYSRAMGTRAASRVAELCNGADRASDLLNVWRDAVGGLEAR